MDVYSSGAPILPVIVRVAKRTVLLVSEGSNAVFSLPIFRSLRMKRVKRIEVDLQERVVRSAKRIGP